MKIVSDNNVFGCNRKKGGDFLMGNSRYSERFHYHVVALVNAMSMSLAFGEHRTLHSVKVGIQLFRELLRHPANKRDVSLRDPEWLNKLSASLRVRLQSGRACKL